MIAGVIAGGQPLAPAAEIPVVGAAFGGGFYAGDITYGGKTYRLVLADKSAEVAGIKWQVSVSVTGATSNFDDAANMAAIVASGISNAPAAEHCKNYSGGGFTDWGLGSKDGAAVMASHLGVGAAGVPAAFGSGGDQAMHATQNYWSSTEFDLYQSWYTKMGNSVQSHANAKYTAIYYVRPVRRVEVP